MSAKREIYARLGVQLRGNRRAFRAEKIAPGAMGLYAFMVMDARAELPEVDGFVAEEVVLSAWGRPADERHAQVEALCEVDLVERAVGGFVVVKYDEHNDCRRTVEKNRKEARLRVARHRRSVTPNIPVTEGVGNALVPISISTSLSSGSGSQIASPPEWWSVVCDQVDQNHGVTLNRGGAWLGYWGHRTDKGKPVNQADALSWLTRVDVPALRKEREDARHREQRDKDFDRRRQQAKDPPPPTPYDREKAREDAKRTAAIILGKKVGT